MTAKRIVYDLDGNVVEEPEPSVKVSDFDLSPRELRDRIKQVEKERDEALQFITNHLVKGQDEDATGCCFRSGLWEEFYDEAYDFLNDRGWIEDE